MARHRLVPQLTRLVWLALPVALGFAIADLLSDRSAAVRAVALTGLWGGWAVGLVVLLVPSTVSLTVFRCLAPAPLAVAVVATIHGTPAGAAVAALAGSAVVLAIALSAEVGRFMVQGSAYGDEARYLLRPPGALLLGPIPLAWVVMAAGACGPLLLAARQWVPGVLVTAIGGLLIWLLGLRLHRLSRRWLVFVPAGLVVHDQLVLAETSMVRRTQMARVGPAPIDSLALDVTGAASGLVLEIVLSEPLPIAVAGGGRGPSDGQVTAALLVAPSQPGQVLDEARRRGYPVAVPGGFS